MQILSPINHQSSILNPMTPNCYRSATVGLALYSLFSPLCREASLYKSKQFSTLNPNPYINPINLNP